MGLCQSFCAFVQETLDHHVALLLAMTYFSFVSLQITSWGRWYYTQGEKTMAERAGNDKPFLSHGEAPILD